MGRGMMGMEIMRDSEEPEQEEEGEGHPGTQNTLFYHEQEGPNNEEDEEKGDRSLKGERKVEMA
jgi:hypothetical protein